MLEKNDKKQDDKSNSDAENDIITLQYRHIKELAQLKYEAEEKREQNLIQQSSQMQTAFSFMTAAVFMAVPICVEYRGVIELKFFLASVSSIITFLFFSLIFASVAQWRWKTETLPDIDVIKSSVIDSPEWEKSLIEHHRINQWVSLVGIVQQNKATLNTRRVYLIMASMVCFYISIASIVISFIVAIIKLL